MNKDKKVLYIVSFVIFAVLFSALFIPIKNTKLLAACLLIPMVIVTRLFIKKKSSVSINKKEVLLLSVILGVIYVILIQLSGIFFGVYKNPYFVNFNILMTAIVPLAVIVIATELIRSTLLAQKNAFVSVFAFLLCLVSEVLSVSNVVGITTFNQFMDLVGMTFFPAICANVYYHYVSKNYGALPNIAYRLITTLYVHFIPDMPGIPDALMACIKVLVPLAILALVFALFEKKKKNALARKSNKLSTVFTLLSVVVIVSMAMLISCQFRFGAIVIATESMSGEINKGDVIIYERYDNQPIKEGQVIVFNKFDVKIIHRVIEIENIGNEVRYYTKGDANEDVDLGYITEEDIVGLTDMKVAYVGYPTLWLRELLDSSN